MELTKKNKIVVLIALMVVVFFLVFLSINPQNINSKNGVLDLSNYKIYEEGLLQLDGEWEFYNGKFLTYEEIQSQAYEEDKIIVDLPSKWNNYITEKGEMGSSGYGTFRLKVKMTKAYKKDFGLYIQRIYSSYKVYIDDQLVAQTGEVGKNKEEETADFEVDHDTFKLDAQTFDIIIHVSNHFQGRGGIRESIYFGTAEQIEWHNKQALLQMNFSIGIFFILFLVILILFTIERNKRNFWFLMITFLLVIRSLFSGDLWIIQMGYDISPKMIVYSDYFSAYGLLVAFSVFYYVLFKDYFSKKVMILIKVYIVSLAIASIVMPIELFTRTVNYGLYLGVAVIPLYYFNVIIKGYQEGMREAKFLFLTNALIYLMALHDVLQVQGIISYYDTQLLPYAIVIYSLVLFALVFRSSMESEISKRQNTKLFSLLDNTPLGIMEVDYFTNDILFINDKIREDYQLDDKKLRQLKIEEFISKDFWSFLKNGLHAEKVLTGYKLEHSDKIFELSLKVKENESMKKTIIVLLTDVTEQQKYAMKLDDVMSNLEIKVKQRTKALQNFKDMVLAITEMTDIYEYSEDEFLSEIFQIGLKVMTKANAGSIYLFEHELVRFIDAKVHDIDQLNDAEISVLDFEFPTSNVRLVSDITKRTKEKFTKSKSAISEVKLEKYDSSVAEIKETLIIGLILNDQVVGGMTLEITTASEEVFTQDDLRLCQVMKDLINSYYTNYKNHKMREQFMKQEKAMLEKALILDDLTGLFNKKYFLQVLDNEWNRCMRNNKPLSLIMMDIDNFKNYNDTYGHVKGDEVLRKVAKTIKRYSRRSSDVIARYGGEEFIALFPETDVEGTQKIAEKIRESVELLNIENKVSPSQKKLTISLGVAAIIPYEAYSTDKFIDQADKLLYLAKENGRNQVKCKKIKK